MVETGQERARKHPDSSPVRTRSACLAPSLHIDHRTVLRSLIRHLRKSAKPNLSAALSFAILSSSRHRKIPSSRSFLVNNYLSRILCFPVRLPWIRLCLNGASLLYLFAPLLHKTGTKHKTPGRHSRPVTPTGDVFLLTSSCAPLAPSERFPGDFQSTSQAGECVVLYPAGSHCGQDSDEIP